MNVCPKCGGAIPPEAPQGLCPKCLLAQASFPTETGPGTRHGRPLPPGREELAEAFPHLEIIELIGQGGMGFVFKARQAKLDRFVALKILAQPLAEQASFAERFTREGRTLAKLNHPNIVTIHDFGQAGPFFYLLMEFVDGVNLRQAMRAGAVAAEQALAIVPKICEALQYAHNEGVLHRDIKPDNILLDARGRVKIADFGIAKLMAEAAAESPLTGSGASLGTPHYMAPEQIERPDAVDHRADIFSLGVVFYEMLTGELPLGRFAAPSQSSGTDPRLDEVVLQTLEKKPERRPQRAQEVGTKVEGIAQQPKATRGAEESAAPMRAAAAKGIFAAIGRIFALAMGIFLAGILLYGFLRNRSENKHAPAIATTSTTPPAAVSQPGKEVQILEASKNARVIKVRTKVDLQPGESISPLTRYDTGTFGASGVTGTGYTFNWPKNEMERTFSWTLPASFASDFEGEVALQSLKNGWVNKTLSIPNNETVELFSAKNAQGQAFSGGLYYRKDDPMAINRAPTATISDLRAYNTTFHESPIVMADFNVQVPYGYRIVPSFWFEDGAAGETVMVQSETSKAQARWLLNGASIKDWGRFEAEVKGLQRTSFKLTRGMPLRVFRAVDGPRRGAAYLELASMWPASDTNPPPKEVEFDWNRSGPQQRAFSLRTTTPFSVGEEVEAVMQYGEGAWEESKTWSRMTLNREPGGHSTVREFLWSVPETFSPEFDMLPAWRRFHSDYMKTPFSLFANEATPLFTMTNSAGQVVSCGLRYLKKAEIEMPERARALVSQFQVNNSLVGKFRVKLPNGFRVEPIGLLGDQDAPSSLWIERAGFDLGVLTESGWTEVAWKIPSGFQSLPPESWIGPVDFAVPFGKPFEVLTLTNKAGEIFRAQLALISMLPGVVDLSGIEQRGNGINLRGSIDLKPNESLEVVMIDRDGLKRMEPRLVARGGTNGPTAFDWNCSVPEGVRPGEVASELRSRYLGRRIFVAPGSNLNLAPLSDEKPAERHLALQFVRNPEGSK